MNLYHLQPRPSLILALLATLIALVCAPGAAQAQVLRCEDAQGKVTYTNAGCPHSQEMTEVIPALDAQAQQRQDAQYQEALARKREAQQLQATRDLAQQQADAARAAAQAAQRPAPAPVIVQVPANEAPPSYGPLYPARPPHVRPPPPKPQPPRQASNCNVFRCYDGKGNTWNRP